MQRFSKQKNVNENLAGFYTSHVKKKNRMKNTGILPDHIDEEEAKKMRMMNGTSGRYSEDTGDRFGKRRRDDNFDLMAAGLSALPQAFNAGKRIVEAKGNRIATPSY